jgi:hypothetical protein
MKPEFEVNTQFEELRTLPKEADPLKKIRKTRHVFDGLGLSNEDFERLFHRPGSEPIHGQRESVSRWNGVQRDEDKVSTHGRSLGAGDRARA